VFKAISVLQELLVIQARSARQAHRVPLGLLAPQEFRVIQVSKVSSAPLGLLVFKALLVMSVLLDLLVA
jgi:hypothetical protein